MYFTLQIETFTKGTNTKIREKRRAWEREENDEDDDGESNKKEKWSEKKRQIDGNERNTILNANMSDQSIAKNIFCVSK